MNKTDLLELQANAHLTLDELRKQKPNLAKEDRTRKAGSAGVGTLAVGAVVAGAGSVASQTVVWPPMREPFHAAECREVRRLASTTGTTRTCAGEPLRACPPRG